MTYQEIKSFINTYIVQNGVNAITGSQLNTALNALADYYGFDSVVVTTLPAGSDATVNVQGRTLELGIPKGAEGQNGRDGLDATNPFKGWFNSLADLKASYTASVGDSAYVKDASPATTWSIYVYDSTESSDNYWADSGLDADTSNVQTFESGEEVNTVPIDNTHLVNPVAGSLAKAEDVKEIKDSTEKIPMDYTANTNLIKPLPEGYVALDYIDNGGLAYIDTGIKPTDANWRLVGAWKRTDTPSASDALIIGSTGDNSANNYFIKRSGTTNDKIKVAAYTRGLFATEVTLSDSGTNWHTFDLKRGTLILDGSTVSISTQTLNALSATIKIGSSGYPLQVGVLTAYHNGEIVAVFQPCKNDSDVYGVFELISRRFIGSANENQFTGGNPTSMELDKLVDGGFLSIYTDKKVDEILFDNTNVIAANSRLDSQTPITSSAAGNWNIIPPSTTFESSSDGTGLRVNHSTVSFSGLKYDISTIAQNTNICIIFEARAVSDSVVLNCLAGIGGTDADISVCANLNAEWKQFRFDTKMGASPYIQIQNVAHLGNRSFEIRNISVLTKVSPMQAISNSLYNLNRGIETILKGKRVSILGDSISTYEDKNAVEFTVLESDITEGRTLQGYPTYYDIGTTIGGTEVTSAMVGVLTSFTPANGDAGKSIGKAKNYNAATVLNPNEVWWKILADSLGASILQNVSWSGASMCSHEGSDETYKTSYAWHDAQINKLSTRDSDGVSITPNVVIIYRGVNDFSHSPYAKLTNYGASSMSIPNTDVIEGGYDFKESYALTIKKIRTAYPHALIICCTLNIFKRVNYSSFPVNNGTNTLPEFNNAIREVADMMGCGLIELDKDGITFENCYPLYISDSSTNSTHPNARGHAKMATKAIADIVKMSTSGVISPM